MAITSNPSQEFIPLKEIREGILILKDGSMRAVLMASSVNFALKSDEERGAILFQFQNFLNSLDFSLQIFVQSRKLDIRPYLALLESRYKAQNSDLMKIQIQEYIGFIKSFTESTSIMTKTFFLIIPYSPAIISSKKGILGGLFSKTDAQKKKKEDEVIFSENLSQLEQRVSVVEQGLASTGIRIARLGTEEMTELFFKIYNPGETEKPIKPE